MNTDKQERIKSIFRRKIFPVFIQLNGTVPDGLETFIVEHCKIIAAVKDQYLAESGETEDGHLLYFESGIARCYYYDAIADKFIVTRIAKKGDVLIDTNAFLYGSKQADNIQLLLAEFHIMYATFLYFLAEKEKQHTAYQHLLKSSVDERVKLFLDGNTGIATRINNDHIATYLDMSRTTFSSAYAKYKSEKDKNR
jgi:CRP-like cAMP-binding protein